MKMKKYFSILVVSLPAISFALQGGPVQPDYVQFEPSGMQDMVNLLTGDFSYQVPLGDLPSPYGNYPLSVSYQAGISPQQEASWVGLGWSLNPGVINRNLRGVPDDQFHGGTLGFIYQYSAMQMWNVDMSVAVGPFGLGMSCSSDGTVGYSVTLGAEVGVAQVGFTMSTDGTVGLGVSTSAGPAKASAGVSYSIKDRTPSASAGAQLFPAKTQAGEVGFGGSMASVGMTVSPNGVSASAGVGPLSVRKSKDGVSVAVKGGPLTVSNSVTTKGHSKTETAGLSLYATNGVVSGSFGYTQITSQYWQRSATSDYVYGYMYQAGPSIDVGGENDFVMSPKAVAGTFTAKKSDIPWVWSVKGRTLETMGERNMVPAYDIYTVASEGVSGSFRPFARETHQMYRLTSDLHAAEDGRYESYTFLMSDSLNDDSRIIQKENEFARSGDDFVDVGDDKFKDYRYCVLEDKDCSPYGLYQTNYRNIGNRLVYNSKENEFEERGGMRFIFMGSRGGYYESEGVGNSAKRDRSDVSDILLKRTIGNFDYALYGSRKIEPIFEDNSQTGKLSGFVITIEDGTKYYFEQPVKSYLKADYSINQATGVPVFVDYDKDKNENFWGNMVMAVGKATEEFLKTIPTTAYFYDWWNNTTLLEKLTGIGAIKAAWSSVSRPFKKIAGMFEGHLDETCKPGEEYDQVIYTSALNLNPYATQWLLTEIRGADFVKLSDKMEENIGYNIKFHYTDPSTYKWRTPYARPGLTDTQLPNLKMPRDAYSPVGCDTKKYQASFGVKENVYLKSIESSTHLVKFKLNDKERVDGKGWDTDYTLFPMMVQVSLGYTMTPSGNKVTLTPKYLYFNTPLTESMERNLYKVNKLFVYQEHLQTFSAKVGDSQITGIKMALKGDVKIVENSYHKTTGAESAYGLYRIEIEDAPLTDGTASCSKAPPTDSILVFGNGGHVKDIPYVNWSDVAFAKNFESSDQYENQMRYLEKVSYYSKRDTSNPYREFIFGYDYSLQPRTLNSYCKYIGPKNNPVSGYPSVSGNNQIANSPDSVGIDVCDNATEKALYGKLTLRSITERGCQNNKCASLPPFRFDYLSPNASSIRLGKSDEWKNEYLLRQYSSFDDDGNVEETASNENQYEYFADIDATILASTNTVDEYGLWSSKATIDNHAVDQELADFQGSAWSLNKIVDPAGGVMEVEYERDVINNGEYYGDDYLTAQVLQFFNCNEEGYGGNGWTCLVLQPLYWRDKCLGVREAYWDTQKPEGDNTDGYAYLKALGITNENPPTVFFNIVSGIKTSVSCGFSHCDRERQTSVVGSGEVAGVVPYKKEGSKKVLILKTPYNDVYAGMQHAADKISTSQKWKVNPISYGSYGTIWTRQELPTMKTGNLRVTRLTRHDMNVNAQTNYDYGIGETAQLADSLYTGVAANRYYKTVNSYVLPNMNLQPISRIVGFNDNDADFVPAAQVMYPKVSVSNSWRDESDAKNGRVEFSYITPESGIPADYIDDETKNEMVPFLKLNLRLMKVHGDEQSNNDVFSIPLFSKMGRVFRVALYDGNNQELDAMKTILLSEDKIGELYFYNQNIKNAKQIKVWEMKGNNSTWLPRTINVDNENFTSYNEIMLEVRVGFVTQENPSLDVIWSRSQKEGMFPILYKKVDYGEKKLTRKGKYLNFLSDNSNYDAEVDANYESSVTFYDLTSFVGLNYKTTFYRGNKDSEFPVKVDSIVYSTKVPDFAEGIITNNGATPLSPNQIKEKIGTQKEHWISENHLDCRDGNMSCSGDNVDLDSWNDHLLTRHNTHIRKPVFQVATITKTGYDNFSDNNGALVATTKIENHAFDPATGNPMASLAVNKQKDGKEMRKLTRTVPFYSIDKASQDNEKEDNVQKRGALADSMFVRNMLSQSYLNEVYSGLVNSNADWNAILTKDSLRSYSISPYGFVDGENSPIVAWGTYSSRAEPRGIYSKALWYARKNDVFPPWKDYSGNQIVSINDKYKVTETNNVFGKSMSTVFSNDGMFQLGIFFPAKFNEVAVVLPYQDTIVMSNCSGLDKHAVDGVISMENSSAFISCVVSSRSGNVVKEYRMWTQSKGWETKSEIVPLNNLVATVLSVSLDLPAGAKLNYLRIYPETAQAKTYIYDVYGNMIQVVAEDNTSTYYEYDPLGKLVQSRNDDGVAFKSHHREWMNDTTTQKAMGE